MIFDNLFEFIFNSRCLYSVLFEKCAPICAIELSSGVVELFTLFAKQFHLNACQFSTFFFESKMEFGRSIAGKYELTIILLRRVRIKLISKKGQKIINMSKTERKQKKMSFKRNSVKHFKKSRSFATLHIIRSLV